MFDVRGWFWLSLCCSVTNWRNSTDREESCVRALLLRREKPNTLWAASWVCLKLWRNKTTTLAGLRSVWCSSTVTLNLLCYYSIIQSASSGPERFTPVFTQLVQLPWNHQRSESETSCDVHAQRVNEAVTKVCGETSGVTNQQSHLEISKNLWWTFQFVVEKKKCLNVSITAATCFYRYWKCTSGLWYSGPSVKLHSAINIYLTAAPQSTMSKSAVWITSPIQ